MNLTNFHTYTKQTLLSQLAALNVPEGSIVLVHTSLRAVGSIEGGPAVLLDALIEHFTKSGGLLCIPTHTWHNLGKEITLDMNSSESCLGAFATIALQDGRGIRSENPSHSMVVFGDRKKAEAFIQDETVITSPTAPNSCYGKLASMGGQILLIGVAQNRNTYLHAVDEMLNVPNRMDAKPIATGVKKASGEIIHRELTLYYTDYTDDISYRFVKYETAFRYHRCITDGFIGNAPTQLCDAAKLKDTVALLYQNSNGMDPLAGEAPIPQKWYCP